MAEVALRIDQVAHPLFEFLSLGKAAIGLALPHLHTVTGDGKVPPVAGSRLTRARSSLKLLSSSWANQAARNNH